MSNAANRNFPREIYQLHQELLDTVLSDPKLVEHLVQDRAWWESADDCIAAQPMEQVDGPIHAVLYDTYVEAAESGTLHTASSVVRDLYLRQHEEPAAVLSPRDALDVALDIDTPADVFDGELSRLLGFLTRITKGQLAKIRRALQLEVGAQLMLKAHGSRTRDLAVPASNLDCELQMLGMDLCQEDSLRLVTSAEKERLHSLLYAIRGVLRDAKIIKGSSHVNKKAKAPFLLCNIAIEVCHEAAQSVDRTEAQHRMACAAPPLRTLVKVLKLLLKAWGLKDSKKGRLPSYPLVTIATSYFCTTGYPTPCFIKSSALPTATDSSAASSEANFKLRDLVGFSRWSSSAQLKGMAFDVHQGLVEQDYWWTESYSEWKVAVLDPVTEPGQNPRNCAQDCFRFDEVRLLLSCVAEWGEKLMAGELDLTAEVLPSKPNAPLLPEYAQSLPYMQSLWHYLRATVGVAQERSKPVKPSQQPNDQHQLAGDSDAEAEHPEAEHQEAEQTESMLLDAKRRRLNEDDQEALMEVQEGIHSQQAGVAQLHELGVGSQEG